MLIYNSVVVFGGVVEKRKHNEMEMEERWLFSEGNSGITLKWKKHGKMWVLFCVVLHFVFITN